MSKKILCMGCINIDLVMRAQGKLPSLGQTLVTDNFNTYPGGKGGNQADAASRLGGDVAYFTKLGDDLFSQQLIDKLRKDGVDTSPIIIEPGQTSGVAMIMVDREGQNSILFTPGGNMLLNSEDVKRNRDLFSRYDILEITLEIHPETAFAAIKLAKEAGLTVVVDPSPVPSGGIPDEIASCIDFVKPNETEASALTGISVVDEETARAAMDSLLGKGFRHPIITLGSKGLLTLDETGKAIRLDAIPVQPVDTTAAGDIFLGAFTAQLSKGKNLIDCLNFAQGASSLSVTKQGAQTSIPTEEEVIALLQNRGIIQWKS